MKYQENAHRMAKVKIDAVKALQDPETGKLFYDICFECDKMLDEEEFAYGHDCEGQMILFIILILGLGLAVNLYAKQSVDRYDQHKGYGAQWDQERYWNSKCTKH